MHGRESIILGSIFFFKNFGGFTCYEVLCNRKITTVDLCVCMHVSIFSISQKLSIAEFPNLIFYVSIICRCCLKLFMKIGLIVCVQGSTKGIKIHHGQWKEFLVSAF